MRRSLLQPQREQRRAGEHDARRELGIDGGAVGKERRRQPGGETRAERPGVGRDPPGEYVGQYPGERGDGG